MQTYTERFARLVTEIQENVKERKQDEGLRFAYDGVGYDLADRTQRMALIERVTEDYVLAHAAGNQTVLDGWTASGAKSERPSPLSLDTAMLDRLTDAILDEELTDPNPHKVSHGEYPFMSEWQLDLRRDRETGLKAAEETGTDGRNHRKPTRRRRTNYENWRVDRDAKGRNKARQEQYKRDTAAGPVVREATEAFVSARSQAVRWRDTLSLVQ
ncbi:hypothetical protein ACX93W_01855 [Paenibacillus sp. CAU 1782]